MKNKKNTLFFISIKIFIVIVFACLCYLNFFQALDFQLYDSLIKLRKQPEQNQKILMVKIDDPSITALGEWPWSRDEIANALLSMKELGAEGLISIAVFFGVLVLGLVYAWRKGALEWK